MPVFHKMCVDRQYLLNNLMELIKFPKSIMVLRVYPTLKPALVQDATRL